MHRLHEHADLFQALRTEGFDRVIARFSGGNDEGQIDSISLASGTGDTWLDPQDPRYEMLEGIIEDGLPSGYHYGPGGRGTAILDLATGQMTSTFATDREW